jgi:VanZ family protein
MIAWWVAVALWGLEISYLSTENFASDVSHSLLLALLARWNIVLSADWLDRIHGLIRKLSHVTEYGIFTLLLYRAFAGAKPFAWRPRLATACVLAAAVYAVIDEFHQSFVPGRGPSLVDSAIDTAGALVAMLAVYAVSRALRPSSQPVVQV